MPSMTPPSSSRVVLMPDTPPAAGPDATKVRRYRLARLRLVERRDGSADRHPQLLRTYD